MLKYRNYNVHSRVVLNNIEKTFEWYRSLEGYPILQRKVSRVYSVTIFKYYNKSVTEYHIPLTDVYLYTYCIV